MKRLRRGIVMGLGLLASLPVWAIELIEWDRRPMDIPLPVGQERIVILDRNVRVGLPGAISGADTLRVQSSGGVLYLLAHEPFDTQRVQLQDVESGEILLVDLSAREGASDEDIKIVEPEVEADKPAGSSDKEMASAPLPPLPVALTRYAAQSLYAPMRTVETVPGVRRVPMRLPESLPTLIPSLPVAATPLGAWTLDNYTVTAVQLTNQDPGRRFELDPRWLQGEFHSAAFMHPDIGPRGRLDDTTSVFIVTRGVGLAQSLFLPVASDDKGGDS
ncbi:TIGR03749 family integrating conjugative element protein [Vreelandella zhaodongensis]|uniref:TIGR03749 family integrating conjugative element protein n=1 Tax=Vreelandella zhaodongensis TaxID=1176240 RepID=UPI003EBA54A8